MEIALRLIGAGVLLTFLALVFRDPSGTNTILSGAANAYSTVFGTFLKSSSTGSLSTPQLPS
jgi:hypothetical protein